MYVSEILKLIPATWGSTILDTRDLKINNLGVVHEDGKLARCGEVAVGHHLLAHVDHRGLHDAPLAFNWVILIPPQPPEVGRPLEANRIQALVQAAFDG